MKRFNWYQDQNLRSFENYGGFDLELKEYSSSTSITAHKGEVKFEVSDTDSRYESIADLEAAIREKIDRANNIKRIDCSIESESDYKGGTTLHFKGIIPADLTREQGLDRLKNGGFPKLLYLCEDDQTDESQWVEAEWANLTEHEMNALLDEMGFSKEANNE